MITGKNHIGYSHSARGTKTYKTFNPKQNIENSNTFYEATPQEIDTAVSLAHTAFKEYRNITGKRRAGFLNAIANEIEVLAKTNILLETYTSETGLSQERAQSECDRTLSQLRMFADLVQQEHWRNPTISDKELKQISIPLGPVVVFGASNFPLAYSTAGGDTASALAAGCTVIVKSHPMHAGTGELVAQAILKAAKDTDMPEGVFSNLNSSGIDVGVQLVKHPKVKAIGFTGSIRGGRALYDLAAQREEPIPVFAEMGSINPVIITQKALENRGSGIANSYAASITVGGGQFCTNPGLILGVASPELTTFINQLGAKVSTIDSHCMLHPAIHQAYESMSSEVLAQKDIGLVASYKGDTGPAFAKAKIATVPGQAFLKNPKLHQEVFGPFSVIVQCKDEAQLLEIIQELEGQLTGTILAEPVDYDRLTPIITALQDRVGRIVFNGVPTGVTVVDAMTHGGPYPASTDSRFTAVGNQSIKRWIRPFSYQGFPKELLPEVFH